MAREPSVLDDDESAGTGPESAGRERNSGLLHRRSYLKLAGSAAAATTAGAAATTAAANEDDYEVVKLSRGEKRQFFVDDGETFENVLIDCTAGGCWPQIVAHGTNWTIRNVGIEGRIGDSNAVLGVSDRGGNRSLIENVYVGDGATGGHRHGLGLWVAPQHTGHIDIRNVNIQEMGDNSFYCSAPGGAGGGTVHIDNCYSANSWVSHFRLAEGKVTNSVAVNDERHKDGRGVWGWAPGPVEVENCHLAMNGRHYSLHARGGVLNVSNTEYDRGYGGDGTRTVQGGSINFRGGNGSNPRDFVPDGCPSSAEEAASGGSSTASGGTSDRSETEDDEPVLPNTIVFDGRDAGGNTSYEFTTSGDVAPSTDEDATIDAEAEVDGNRASGVVANWLDAFRFEGELEDLSVDGPATVRVNGVEIDPDAFDDGREHVLVVEGSEEGVTRYEFVVDGPVEKSDDEGASIDPGDEVDGGTVHGVVANWKDAFRFDGDLEELTVDGPATVTLDGEVVDPFEYGGGLPHVLAVEGDGTPASFEITVDGTVAYDGDGEPEDDATVISGTTVQSSVADGVRRFRFSGTLTDVTFSSGEATVTVDGEEVDLDACGDGDLLPHAVVFDGTGTDGRSTYSFEATGAVVESDHRGASTDEDDVVEGRAVRGSVANWLDAYWFDGDLVDVTVDGDAAVHVEYNARDR